MSRTSLPLPAPGSRWVHRREGEAVKIDSCKRRGALGYIVTHTELVMLIVREQKLATFMRAYRPDKEQP